MKKECKHPLKSIKIKMCSESSPDGYGGRQEWNWMELECKSCNKSLKMENRHIPYTELTGRDLDIKECTKIFLKNKNIYRILDISGDRHDLILRTVGKHTDQLAKKIENKKKIIAKHKKELQSMLSDFHGGDIPFYETL